MKMRSWLVSLALLCAVGLVPGCGTAPDYETDGARDRESRLVAAALAVVDDPLRPDEDRARDAVDPREGLHRIDAELVMAEILAAGFVLEAESDLLSNPGDTRDWNIFADDAANRDKTDRFVWRFVKPAE